MAHEYGLDFYTANTIRMNVNNNGNVGIGTTSPDALLTVNGAADKPGGGSWSTFSDVRLKKNIQPLSGVLQKLLALRGVSFEYKEPEKIHELSGERIGMIAQEVEQVFPDWVESGPEGYKRLTYRGFEALTVEALRELRDEKDAQLQARDAEMQGLNQKVEQKETEITELKARLERLEQLVPQKMEVDNENTKHVGQASCLSHSFPNRLLKQQSFKLETGWKPVLLCLALLLCQAPARRATPSTGTKSLAAAARARAAPISQRHHWPA